jgi:cytochrome c
MDVFQPMNLKVFFRGALRSVVVTTGLIAQAASAAPASTDGATVFRQRCQACHTVVAGKPSSLAPNLAGVVGRKAASLPFNYSAALKRSGLTWDRNSLDRYLASPSRLVPGTRMTVTLSDTRQRAALIAYLSRAK